MTAYVYRWELSIIGFLLFLVFTTEVIYKVVSPYVLVLHIHLRLQTSTLLGEFHKWLLWVPLHPHLLPPRELQPLPEVHPILLSGAHCVPSVGGRHLLQWVQCGVQHPQPDEVCELPVHCHCTPWQPKGKSHCRGKLSHVKWVTTADEDGKASKLDWELAFTSPRHSTFMYNGHA